MKSRVSVVIPAYNAERTLPETIESVLRQTYRDFETIVVDDGSTDNTLAIARSFEPQIRVLQKENGGPASARNRAIQNSTSEYIAFLDSDDLWMDQKLEKQIDHLDRRPEVGLVFSEALMFSGDDPERQIEKTIGFTGPSSFRLLLYGDYIPNSTVVIRRKCVDAVGLLNERRDLIAVEDYEYWMRIARKFPIEAIPEPMALYRIHDRNLMGKGDDIDRGLRLSLSAIYEIERRYPMLWLEHQVDRRMLLARLYVRAGFAWKQRRDWPNCVRMYREALRQSRHPCVLGWIAAATLRKRWS